MQKHRVRMFLITVQALLTAVLFAWPLPAQADVIETIAGNGIMGYSGDGGLAIQASLSAFHGVTVDSAGNIYIGDTYNARVRKVDVNGIITTVAGNGIAGYSGDGGPAAQASLNQPRGVAADNNGNIYIADFGNCRIRKVDLNGVITTVAGTGILGYSGDGGPAVQANLSNLSGVTTDSIGNIYIADTNNHAIRKVDVNGVITTLAGNGIGGYSGDGGPAAQASLNRPYGVTVDSAGNFYIAEEFNHRIRRVDVDGIIMTVAGNGTAGHSGDGGPATQASLYYPYGIAVDAIGNIYCAEQAVYVRKVDTYGIITTVAGNGIYGYSGDGGPAAQASLSGVRGVAVDSLDNLYIADHGNYRLRRVTVKPIANFTASPTRGSHPLTVTFTNTTSPAPSGTTYLWSFGDGTTSTEVNPMHIYSDKGIYTVTLTATGPSGLPEDSTSKVQTDIICSGYIFSSDAATASTALFTRTYSLGTVLYGRVWATLNDVDYTQLKNAKLKVTDSLGNSVAEVMVDEGTGNFSGSLTLNAMTLVPGNGTVSFSIRDKDGKEYTATENVTLN